MQIFEQKHPNFNFKVRSNGPLVLHFKFSTSLQKYLKKILWNGIANYIFFVLFIRKYSWVFSQNLICKKSKRCKLFYDVKNIIVMRGKTNQVLGLLLNRAHTDLIFKFLKYAFWHYKKSKFKSKMLDFSILPKGVK